jgi:hypothetical protein
VQSHGGGREDSTMTTNDKHPASNPLLSAIRPNLSTLLPPDGEFQEFGSQATEGFELIERAATLIRTSEQRALQAEERAEKVSAKAIEAVKAAQLRVEQTEAHVRQIEQHAAEQAKLAQERITKAEALAQERVDKAEAWAQEADERARAAQSRLQAAEMRASDAEEQLQRLTETLKRKLSPAVPPLLSSGRRKARNLN